MEEPRGCETPALATAGFLGHQEPAAGQLPMPPSPLLVILRDHMELSSLEVQAAVEEVEAVEDRRRACMEVPGKGQERPVQVLAAVVEQPAVELWELP